MACEQVKSGGSRYNDGGLLGSWERHNYKLGARRICVNHSEALLQRLAGIQKSLSGLYESGGGMSTASRGREREHFIDLFPSRVLPPGYRFGSGDIIDTFGSRLGQVDVVVEFTFLPSLPALTGSTRLYPYNATFFSPLSLGASDARDTPGDCAVGPRPRRRGFPQSSTYAGVTRLRRTGGAATPSALALFSPNAPSNATGKNAPTS
jgi:hypothetical protein